MRRLWLGMVLLFAGFTLPLSGCGSSNETTDIGESADADAIADYKRMVAEAEGAGGGEEDEE